MSLRIAIVGGLRTKNKNKVVKKYKNKSPLLYKTTGGGQYQTPRIKLPLVTKNKNKTPPHEH